MEYLLAKKCTEPDEYRETKVQIDLISEDGKHRIALMQRCGITPTGYPDRATYIRRGRWEGDEIFIYDGGYFWNRNAWYSHHEKETP